MAWIRKPEVVHAWIYGSIEHRRVRIDRCCDGWEISVVCDAWTMQARARTLDEMPGVIRAIMPVVFADGICELLIHDRASFIGLDLSDRHLFRQAAQP